MGGVGHRVAFPRGTVRYRVRLDRLKTRRGRGDLERIESQFRTTKRLRKVIRYLRVASISQKGKHIDLDTWLYEHDRMGTVLQRLNRWVNEGTLSLTPRAGRRGLIRLRHERKSLTTVQLRRIADEANEWADHKRETLEAVFDALDAEGPVERRRLVLEHFGDPAEPNPELVEGVCAQLPKWLRA